MRINHNSKRKLKVIKTWKDPYDNGNHTECEFNKPSCEKTAVYFNSKKGINETSYLVKTVLGQFIQKNPCCKSCIKWIDNAMYEEKQKSKS